MSVDDQSVDEATRIKRLIDTGHFTEAEHRLRRRIASGPEPVRWLQLLGQSTSRRGDHAAAAKAFGELVRLRPRSPVAHYCFANTLLRLNRQKDAIPLLRRALELKPEMPQVQSSRSSRHALTNELTK